MKTRITQSELARKLGLSRSTVAAALNPASKIWLTEKTRRRVMKAAEKWNYRADRYARVMRGGKSGLIGLLHFGGLLQVASERTFHATGLLRAAGYEVFSADLSWSVESARLTCLSMLDARVEGVVVAGLNDRAALGMLDAFRTVDLPVVGLSGSRIPWAPHFRGHARQSFLEMTRHLLSLGHRRLALMLPVVTGQDDHRVYSWALGDRIRGFEQALRETGGQVSLHYSKSRSAKPTGIIVKSPFAVNPFDVFATGDVGMKEILSLPVRPTAVLCSNDELACGAMQACREQKIVCPTEMAITGHDDIALGRYLEVPLTTIRQPNRAMAEAATGELLEQIRRAKRPRSNAVRLFPSELIVRASCGFPVTRNKPESPCLV